MADTLVTYCVVHQPRRLLLPARPIPQGTKPKEMAAFLFDDAMNRRYFEKVARWCYYPATEMFTRMLDRGFKLGLGFSVSFLWQLRRWDRRLANRFRRLVSHPNCELVGVEPYHGFAFALDIGLFQEEMKRGKAYAEDFFGKEIRVTDTTEMVLNNEIYFALAQAGYTATMLDGRPWVMEWREPTRLYRHAGKDLAVFCRHHELSDDVGYRFSNVGWVGHPLTADTYARLIRETWGRMVFLGWDYETFGEHQKKDTGIFDFLKHMPDAIIKKTPFKFMTALGSCGAFCRDALRTCRYPSSAPPGQDPGVWSSSSGTPRNRQSCDLWLPHCTKPDSPAAPIYWTWRCGFFNPTTST